MSIPKIIERAIVDSASQYEEYLVDLKGDGKTGSLFMAFALDIFYSEDDFENIDNGIVDSAYRSENHDYGIDAIYIRNNKRFIEDIGQLGECNQDSIFKFHIFQFKKGTGIDQASILKLKKGIESTLIKENITISKNRCLHERLLTINEIKNKIFIDFPSQNIVIEIYLVFTGNKETVEEDDLIAGDLLSIEKLLSENGYSNHKIKIIDGKKLIDWKKRRSEIIDIISYEKSFKYVTESDSASQLNGYISVVRGKEIAKLVQKHKTALFEANIRDYYRKADLNSKILETSADDKESKYFWSYNNGLTITCSKVEDLPNSQYRLHGIQIVNGCQTSNSLYQAFYNIERTKYLQHKKENEKLTKKEDLELQKIQDKFLSDKTTVLTKIIETNDKDLIYKITETTNSQTPIKAFSLKANDNIQILIEEFLLQNGIYYERRINFYKNQNKRNLISIQKLFQLYLAYYEIMPSQIKTAPKSFLDSHYERVFSNRSKSGYNKFELYRIAIVIDQTLSRKIRVIQRSKLETDTYKASMLSYGKLHLGCFIIKEIVGQRYNPKGIVFKMSEILDLCQNEQKFDKVYNLALDKFKKMLQSNAGQKKESIREALRRKKMDNQISKYCRTT